MELVHNALRTQGFITAAQARGMGCSRKKLASIVKTEDLDRPLPGIYVPKAERFPTQLHALLTQGLLADRPEVIPCQQSALALLGCPFYNVPTGTVHVCDPRAASRAYPSVHRHVLREHDRTVVHAGFEMIEPALAVAKVAAAYGPSAGVVAADWLLHEQHCTPDDYQRILESGRIRRGAVAARYALTHADGRAESPGESLLRGFLIAANLEFDLQVVLPGPQGYRVDVLVAGCVVLEFDGKTKYEGADGPQALFKEKVREDGIREQNYGFVRVFWEDFAQPARLIARIRAAIVSARARRFVA